MSSRHIDPSTLDRLFKGDAARVEQWMRLYLEDSPSYLRKLAEATERDDTATLVSVVHDLRPQAHYLGCGRMLELLIAIGQQAQKDGAAACRAQVSEMLELCSSIEAELRELVG